MWEPKNKNKKLVRRRELSQVFLCLFITLSLFLCVGINYYDVKIMIVLLNADVGGKGKDISLNIFAEFRLA